MGAIGRALAWVFQVDVQNKKADPVSRGESVFSVASGDSYVEDEPTSAEWIRETFSGFHLGHYLKSLFPIITWLPYYNGTWFLGDLVAGVTIGAVVVPQGMAYALLAQLPAQFGLYSAFMGVIIYPFLGTSKDITIGPVAVMSQVTGTVVLKLAATYPQYQGYQIASALAIIGGCILAFMGLIRIGWIVDFISITAVTAFITGASLNILVGQVPGLMGISKTYVNSRAATYMVIIDTLKEIRHTKLDAAMGLTALVMLYLIRFILTTLAKKNPSKARLYFFFSTLRTVFVILLYTLISWAVNKSVKNIKGSTTNAKTGAVTQNSTKAHWSILGHVPRGFQNAGVPIVNRDIIKSFTSEIPSTVIVLLIEHIAISKSFGRINGYTINPSQELLSIGVTNCLAPFLGAYPATGSFSRTAIKSKAGVRTPFAGWITGIVVLLAIYALPAVFFWIPNAVLSAVIIHAVGDLIAPPNVVYQFWRISPLEVIIFFIGVIVTVFSTIEDGIYTTISVSAAMLLWRVAKAQGRFLGKVNVHSVVGDSSLAEAKFANGESNYGNSDKDDSHTVYLPLSHEDGSNPSIEPQEPYPGVFVFRFSEGFNYPNANHYLDRFVEYIFARTRRTNPNIATKLGDRPWNNPGKSRKVVDEVDWNKPALKAVILDFSSVNNVDITSVQTLIDVRNQLDRYASPEVVEWHFANINNRWTKRGLAAAGFGLPIAHDGSGEYQRWKPIYSVAEIGGSESAAAAAQDTFNERRRTIEHERSDDFDTTKGGFRTARVAVVNGINRPFFHIDISTAVQSAINSIELTGRHQQNGPSKVVEDV